MYLTTTGAAYNAANGNRTASTGASFDIGVWIDFNQSAIQGGGFDIVFDTTNVTSLMWTWSDDISAGDRSLDGSSTANGWEGIQFDNFGGNGYGGTTGSQPGFLLVGTLSVTLNAASNLLFEIMQPYGSAGFPNCWAPGAASGNSGCQAVDYYNLQVNAGAPVPVPAAVWLMLTGLGSMLGFSRRKAA